MQVQTTCKKCGNEALVMRRNQKNPAHVELICSWCGTWQKFVGTEEQRVREVQAPHTSIPPGYYRHFKGALYLVIGMANHTETGEELVIYRPVSASTAYARPADMWFEHVERDGYSGPRFVKE